MVTLRRVVAFEVSGANEVLTLDADVPTTTNLRFISFLVFVPRDRFNTEIDAALQGLIWLHPRAPHSYYKNARGRNIMSCPYRLVDYWWMTRSPKEEDYNLHLSQAARCQAAEQVRA